jgi:hypothetical protein
MNLEVAAVTIDYNTASSGIPFDFTHSLATALRNVHKVRVHGLVLPMLKDGASIATEEPYVTLVIEPLGIRMPFFYDARYLRFEPYYEQPVLVTEDHVETFDTPIGSVNRLEIKVLDSDENVIDASRTIPQGSTTTVVTLTLFHRPLDARDPPFPLPSLSTDRLLMMDFRFTRTDLETYRFQQDFPDAFKNVSEVKLLGLLVRPFEERTSQGDSYSPPRYPPYVLLKLPGLGLEWAVHFDYWSDVDDRVPLAVPHHGRIEVIDPSRHIQRLQAEVHIPLSDGTTRLATRNDHSGDKAQDRSVRFYALFRLTTQARLGY